MKNKYPSYSDFGMTTPKKKKTGPVATHNENYMSINQFCKEFDCSRQSVYNWVKQGLIHKYKMGCRVYLKRSEIENILNTK